MTVMRQKFQIKYLFIYCYSEVEPSNSVDAVQPAAVGNPAYLYSQVVPRSQRSQPSLPSSSGAAASADNLAAQVWIADNPLISLRYVILF